MNVKCLSVLLLVIAVATTMVANVAQGGMVACYYQMNEVNEATTITDASGNGLDLTADVSPFTGEAGISGLASDMAAKVDDASKNPYLSSLTAAEVGLFNTETFTIEAWIKNPTQAEGGDQMGIFQYRNGGGNRVALRLTSDNQLGLAIDASSEWDLTFSSTSYTFENDVWYHVAVTYNNNGDSGANDSTVAFYVTAFDEASPSMLGDERTGRPDLNTLTAGGDLRIGSGGDANRILGGCIDEVRYTNSVLAPSEFNFPANIPEPSTMILLLIGTVCLAATRLRRRNC